MFFKIGVLKDFANYTGKHLCWSLIGLQASNFIKNRLQHRCFRLKFGKFLRTPFFTKHIQWHLLQVKSFALRHPRCSRDATNIGNFLSCISRPEYSMPSDRVTYIKYQVPIYNKFSVLTSSVCL